MNHVPRSAPTAAAFLAVLTAMATGPLTAQIPAEANPQRAAIAAAIDAFVAAFNAHDASALGALWSENAIHHTPETGQVLRGRAAIAAAYGDLFKQDPRASLAVEVDSLSFNSSEQATILGFAVIAHERHAPSRSRFHAKLVRANGDWLIDRVDEADLPPDAAVGLGPLAWLAGTWAEDAPTGRVVNRFHWAPGNAFLVRSYWHEPAAESDAAASAHEAPPPEPLTQGTQVMGWDAEQLCIRTWLFDSHGSFGEGVWKPAGEARWTNKLAVKLPDGRRASLTQVLEKMSDDQFSLQAIDREIDGAALPNGPTATFARVAGKATPPSDAAAGEQP